MRALALQALCAREVDEKLQRVAQLAALPTLTADPAWECSAPPEIPGHPAKPELVAPGTVPRRAMHTPEGRAATLHALTHIEFNAINLALDALWRFSGMPQQYYVDWHKVAVEEALHFTLLRQHLRGRGYEYGDFVAHNSLWEMAQRTRHDLLARMALVPRTLEARGLDATPLMRQRLAQAGEHEAAAILDIILHDEIGHVAIGNHWYAYLCQQQQRDPLQVWQQLRVEYEAPKMRPPFNLAGRRAAGFSEAELALLG
ncbi:MAG: ferritin-like domain-containing protein [Burkholderiales bacterium]|nr:ferritin-like domain-containing protein [Burkholderiales bacterium]